MLRRNIVKSVFSLVCILGLLAAPSGSAEVDVTPKKKKEAVQIKIFKLDSVIAPQIAALGEPKMRPGSVGVVMGVSSPSEKARLACNAGKTGRHMWESLLMVIVKVRVPTIIKDRSILDIGKQAKSMAMDCIHGTVEQLVMELGLMEN